MYSDTEERAENQDLWLRDRARSYTPWEEARAWRRRFFASLLINLALVALAWVLYWR
jgi:hypothetical protein